MESTERIQQEYIDLQKKYKNLTEASQLKAKETSAKIIKSGWIRVIVFVSLFVAPFYLYNYSELYTLVIEILLIIYFASQIKKSISLKKLKEKYDNIALLNLMEIKALNGDWSEFESGKKYQNPQHDFSYDLDLFGIGSFFQYINRTCTLEGENELHQSLASPLLSNSEIIEQQQAIEELAEKLEFRQGFYAIGKALNESEEDLIKIKSFKTYQPLLLNKGKVFHIFKNLLPALFILSSVGIIWGLSSTYASLLFMTNLSFIGSYLKKVNKVNNQFSALTQILKKYSSLTDLIANENFKSAKLIQLRQKLKENNQNASQIINELSKYMGNFDQRNGMIGGLLLNGMFLWDFIYVLKIEKWLIQHNENLSAWINITHEIDALNSMAGYVYNHPDFIFPQPSDDIILEANHLGHPLIDRNERICNDFAFNSSIFTLITGANMSGKSTFLRTIGLSIVAARCGMTVCAKQMTFKPLSLVTNMRTTDSLMKHESYFFAELKRLQLIINKLEQGEKLFIILDEILKGTNSKDKTYGSMELIRKLIKLKAFGLIATHDLELEILEDETNKAILNMCFEVENKNNSLKFDYKLYRGITQNHNATFLMKQMGIIDPK